MDISLTLDESMGSPDDRLLDDLNTPTKEPTTSSTPIAHLVDINQDEPMNTTQPFQPHLPFKRYQPITEDITTDILPVDAQDQVQYDLINDNSVCKSIAVKPISPIRAPAPVQPQVSKIVAFKQPKNLVNAFEGSNGSDTSIISSDTEEGELSSDSDTNTVIHNSPVKDSTTNNDNSVKTNNSPVKDINENVIPAGTVINNDNLPPCHSDVTVKPKAKKHKKSKKSKSKKEYIIDESKEYFVYGYQHDQVYLSKKTRKVMKHTYIESWKQKHCIVPRCNYKCKKEQRKNAEKLKIHLERHWMLYVCNCGFYLSCRDNTVKHMKKVHHNKDPIFAVDSSKYQKFKNEHPDVPAIPAEFPQLPVKSKCHTGPCTPQIKSPTKPKKQKGKNKSKSNANGNNKNIDVTNELNTNNGKEINNNNESPADEPARQVEIVSTTVTDLAQVAHGLKVTIPPSRRPPPACCRESPLSSMRNLSQLEYLIDAKRKLRSALQGALTVVDMEIDLYQQERAHILEHQPPSKKRKLDK